MSNAKSSPKLMETIPRRESPTLSSNSPIIKTSTKSPTLSSPTSSDKTFRAVALNKKNEDISNSSASRESPSLPPKGETSVSPGISAGVIAAIVVAAIIIAILTKKGYDYWQSRQNNSPSRVPVDFGCKSNSDCSPGTFCSDNGRCYACLTDAQCTSTDLPFCSDVSHSCVQCNTDTDCPSGNDGTAPQTCQQGTCGPTSVGHKHSANCKH